MSYETRQSVFAVFTALAIPVCIATTLLAVRALGEAMIISIWPVGAWYSGEDVLKLIIEMVTCNLNAGSLPLSARISKR